MINSLLSKYFIYSTTDINGVITDVSEAFCTISGYSRDELIGTSHNIIRHPDMPKELFSYMWDTILEGSTWSGELKNKKKDGGYFWTDSVIEPIFGLQNEILGFKAVRFDITSKKELEVALIEKYKSLVIYEKFFMSVNVGLAVTDFDGVINKVNRYMVELLGYEDEAGLIGQSCHNLTRENYKELNMACFINAVNSDLPQTIIKQCRKKNGDFMWVDSIFQTIDTNKVLVSIKNIDSYKKLEEVSAIITSQSRQAAMGEMLSMIAHQWRQPLATISIITTKMGIKYRFNEYNELSFDEDLHKLQEIVQHLSKTIDFFRNYFKEKDGSRVRFDDLFRGIKTIIEPLSTRQSVELEFDIDGYQDKLVDNRLDQVLINIYKNGIEAFDNKQSDAVKLIHTQINKISDCRVEILISDNAGGIPVEVIGRLFEPYFSTKSKNGTGLGLYMSRKIIQDIFNGDLSVKNTKSGACFMMSISLLSGKTI